VKGFLSFSPLAFTHLPPDMTSSNLCEDLMFGNCLVLCLQNLWFISVKKLATFGYVVGMFLLCKFKLILGILNWSANKNKIISLSNQLL